jgi:hypothetical protein
MLNAHRRAWAVHTQLCLDAHADDVGKGLADQARRHDVVLNGIVADANKQIAAANKRIAVLELNDIDMHGRSAKLFSELATAAGLVSYWRTAAMFAALSSCLLAAALIWRW